MKKLLAIVLILALTIAASATGFAAPKTFTDVPAKHWAYDAVAKLAKDGIIEGYGDGTFRGDKPLNRYEFALLTVKALDRFDRAYEAQKKLIDKLSAEFAAELNRMGARLAKVEAKTNSWVAGGDARFRYYTNNPKYPGAKKLQGSDTSDFRARIRFAGMVNENTLLQGRLTTNYGVKFGNTEAPSQPYGSTAMIDIFNVTSKNALGFDSLRIGRTPLDVIGNGLMGKPMAVDGVTVKKKLGDMDFTAFTGNIKTDVNAGTGTGDSGNANQLTTVQLAFKPLDGLKMGVGYYHADIPGTSTANNGTLLASAGASFQKSDGLDLSFNYKFGSVTLLADYISSSLKEPVGLSGSPKAWAVQLSNGTGPSATAVYYPVTLLVKPTMKGTGAWAISYRSVDPGAIPSNAGGFDTTAIAYNQAYNIFSHGTDNVKAIYLTYQHVLDKNVVLSLEYQDFKIKNRSMVAGMSGDQLDRTFMTKLEYFF